MSEYCERMLAEAQAYIGRESTLRWSKYPVEHEPIRRWCHMVELNHPRYLDPEYAAATSWGKVECPPPMIPIFASAGQAGGLSSSGPAIDWPPATEAQRQAAEASNLQVPTPGSRGINMGTELEFFKRVFVGDRIGSKNKLVQVYIKPIRIDPEAFWIATDTVYLNQDLEVVAINHGLRIRHRDPKEIEATTPEQLEQVLAARRG